METKLLTSADMIGAKEEIELLKQQVEALRQMANSQQKLILDQQDLLREITFKVLEYENGKRI